MKKYVSIILTTLSPIWLFAEPVDSLLAKQVASTFMNEFAIQSASKSSAKSASKANDYSCQKYGNIYVVNNAGGGWVLVSADDCVRPVLAYSADGEFSMNNIAPAAKEWIDSYSKQIETAQGIVTQNDVEEEWNQLRNGKIRREATNYVEPLIKTKWSQSPGYNDYCPEIGGEKAVTGCVATAMAQVMNYWQWPKRGVGFYEYKSQNCGTVATVFGVHEYDWNNMPEQLTDSFFENLFGSSVESVAELMFDCGVSVDMDYGVDGSSALPKDVKDAMVQYFKYSPDMMLEHKDSYTNDEWTDKLKKELNSNRPILYYGFGEGGGHAFVCDGFDANDYFHINWGWNGSCDAYYYIDYLVPAESGIGANSNGDYSMNQQAYFGVKPSYDKQDYDLRMYDNDLWLSEQNNDNTHCEKFWYGKDTYYHAKIANYGINVFSGSFVIATFDEQKRFMAFSDTINKSIQKDYYVDLIFKIKGDLKYLPKNNYYAFVFYKDDYSDGWVAVSDNIWPDNSQNFAKFGIDYSTSIEVNSETTVFDNLKKCEISNRELKDGDEYTFTVKIINNGSVDYDGAYRLSLMDIQGNSIEVIGLYEEPQPLKSGGTHNIILQNKIDVEPGTYILSLSYFEDDHWYIASATDDFLSASYFDVIAKYDPDQYEDNNAVADAYDFPLEFDENEEALVMTATNNNGVVNYSNLHKHGDVDYYKLDLAIGYNYEINATIINNNDDDGLIQTTADDVAIEYSYDGKRWFEGYDYEYRCGKNIEADDRYDKLTVKNGGVVYVKIYHPWGMKGNYVFLAGVTRMQKTNVSSIADTQAEISVCPNPATDYITINAPDCYAIKNIAIYDCQGRKVLSSDDTQIDVTGLNRGIYIIEIQTNNGIIKRKVLKQ